MQFLIPTLVTLLLLFSPACTKKNMQTHDLHKSGPIRITVKDENGDPLPGAILELEDRTKGIHIYKVTQADGGATILDLPKSTLQVTASFVGFQDNSQTLVIQPGKPANLSLTMQVSKGLEEELVITANLPIVENATRGRRVSEIMFLAPGSPSAKSYVGPLVESKNVAHPSEKESTFIATAQTPVSTFSVDVDTAAYSNIRAHLIDEVRPPVEQVRIEEMINYFRYDQEEPSGAHPLSVTTEVGPSPWHPDRLLARIGLKARSMPMDARPPANLVFLIDSSGSMQSPDKLDLVIGALGMLAQNLSDRDRVSIVVYAGSAGVLLEPTRGDDYSTIVTALAGLRAGGGTHGSQGIEAAYQLAQAQFIPKGINRVILATDGDFNIGLSQSEDLADFIAQKAATGVFLTVLGVGRGFNDHLAETLADRGNGNYAFLDDLEEARKVLVDQIDGTLVTVAKDVKLQITFNPQRVASYRLIGYENRRLNEEDFVNDKVDAGEMGAGHSVVALYELEPTQYGPEDEFFDLAVRYKLPDAEVSEVFTHSQTSYQSDLMGCSDDFRFASAVAAFGMKLSASPYLGDFSLDQIYNLGETALGEDYYGHRVEFLDLVDMAHLLLPVEADANIDDEDSYD